MNWKSKRWQIEIRHDGLKKYRLIQGNDKHVVEQKAAAQKAAWDELWQKRLDKEQRELDKKQRAFDKEQKEKDKQSKIQTAIERTTEASKEVEEIEKTLKHVLNINFNINWDRLKDYSKFNKPKPQLQQQVFSQQPYETDSKYRPKLGILDKIWSPRKQKKINNAKLLFKKDYDKWLNQKEETIKKNTELEFKYKSELKQWETEEQEFLFKQREKNAAIDRRKEQYLIKLSDAVVDYCDLILSNSQYPDWFPQEFDLDYNSQTNTLIVNYSLPSIDNIPKLKEVKYVRSKDEFVEIFLAESTINQLYDSLIYQITLRTIYELYEADAVNALDSIVFNGWVKSIDIATGQEVNACILSIQAMRQEFLSINMASVDPKACFKKLKGVGSSKLHSLTPIAPIMNINREDKRFTSSYEVADNLDSSSNLAAMDWEDFEHLIREIFEKEFSQSGGEVKVTQASRDHGVDAVAFDPDPIRGGKIVIQAKRYTNIVGVSAVRDLYGTVLNEGATKGILVTTADYGPDAYEFARGKPLTLLNGSNLLYLLEKHGHKATIDLKAAKLILSEREQNNNQGH